MAVKLTHLTTGREHIGWYLLFSGDQDDFNYAKDTLKSYSKGPYKGVWYVGEYEWENRSKKGAWWVSLEVWPRVNYLFSNVAEKVTEALFQGRSTGRDTSPPPQNKTLKTPSSVKEAFEVLKLPMTANKDEVKKAYRTLAFQYHPDHGGDLDKMKTINLANDIIQRWLAV